MKSVPILILLFVVQLGLINAQQVDLADYFVWQKDRPLKFSDYKIHFSNDTSGYLASYYKDGRLIDTLLPDAFTDTNLLYYGMDDTLALSGIEFNPDYELVGNKLLYNNSPLFYPHRSYMKIRTPDILCHEQIHFNIVEVYARELRRYFIKNEHKGDKMKIYNRICRLENEIDRTNKVFDEDAKVDFIEKGNIKRSDSTWKKKIDAQLTSLSEYERPHGSVVIKK